MARLRLSISKDEPLRFLGHLDFLRMAERMLRRANLPMSYTEGFNPRMKMNFDAAVAVGVTASPLYMDIELDEELPVAEVRRRLEPQLPNGVRFIDGRYIAPKVPKLMAWINYERYRLWSPTATSVTSAELAAVLDAFNAREEVAFRKVTPKKVRDIDARPMLPAAVVGTVSERGLVLEFGVLRTERGSIKPGDVYGILIRDHGLTAVADEFISDRLEVYYRDESGRCLSPLSEEAIQ